MQLTPIEPDLTASTPYPNRGFSFIHAFNLMKILQPFAEANTHSIRWEREFQISSQKQ
jgi:hypothetical protein